MAVSIKSEREIGLMREAGHILESVLDELHKELHAGMTTKDIDRIGERLIRERGCTPSFLGYNGYPASICVSVNEEVVHGIPSDNHTIREGDIVSLDAGVIYKGYQADAARTYGVGQVSEDAQNLMKVTEQSFFEGIKYAREGCHLFDISAAIDDYVSQFGYGVVRDLCGHGLGTSLHEDPEIPNFRMDRKGILLKKGMVLCIEPMINLGTWEVDWMDDNWTVVSRDLSLSSHYENTVLITDGDPELFTLSGGRHD